MNRGELPKSAAGLESAVFLFARQPRLGQVKTRLASEVGGQLALKIYEACLGDSLRRFSRIQTGRRVLWIADGEIGEARRIVEQEGLGHAYEVCLQGAGDLGARLELARQEGLEKAESVIFLGGDSPTLPLSYLARAITLLREVPNVVGPARDGGYYLLGVTRHSPDLFRRIPWGTGDVLRATLERFDQGSVVMLPWWYDVDRSVDLERLERVLACGRVQDYPNLSAVLSRVREPQDGT